MVSPRRPTPRRTARGFALVDAIVAGVLLGVGLSAIIGLASSALSSQRRGENLQRAAMLADERLSEVVAVGPEAFPSAFDRRGRCEPPFEDFAFEVTLTPGEGAEPYLVGVEITWRTAGRDRSLLVETLVAPRRGDEPDPEREPDDTVERRP